MNLYRLSDLQFTSTYFSAMDCIFNSDGERAIYCSTELTSGMSVYSAMRANNVHTLDQLDKKDKSIYKRVKEDNKKAAAVFASTVREQNERAIVVNPAPFESPGWEQAEYYAFWDELIRTRVKHVSFNDKWEFSNGCTYELAVALDEGIPIFDSKGNSLEATNAITAIESALQWLHHEGFDEALKKLRRHRDLCREILQRKEEVVRQQIKPDFKRAGKNQLTPRKSSRT